MNFSKFFLILTVAVFALAATSCTKEDPEPRPEENNEAPETISFFMEPEEKTTKLFVPDQTSDMLVLCNNKGNTPLKLQLEVVADDDGTTRVLDRPIDPGASYSAEFASVVAVFCEVDPSGDPILPALDFFAIYSPTSPGGFGATDWLSAGVVCVNGEVDTPTDSDIDCLWDRDVIWESVEPRKIDLEIEITGDHDLFVDIEYEGGIYQGYNVSAPPALPQFQTLAGEWEDVVAVYIEVEKSPVNDCSNGKYDYSICYQ
jgi:hypothetical protein